MNIQISCSKCGLCVRECKKQSEVISLTENGVMIELDGCNRCGHCEAVCPTDAMQNPLSPRQPLVGPLPSAEDMARYLRAARSVRYYKEELAPRDAMLRLLDIGRFAQTGNNRQGVSYLVVEGREKIVALNDLFCREVNRVAKDDPSLGWVKEIVDEQLETGEDIVFRGCSQLILALTEENLQSGAKNAQFALTFIALLAPSLGLGTCWAGIFERLATSEQYGRPFRELLQVPDGKVIRAAMMTGIPDVSFRRLVERDPLAVEWR